MTRKISILALLVLGLFVVSNTMAWAASSPKIGHFDLQQVLDKSSVGKQAKDSFKDQKAKVKEQMEEKSRAFRTAKEELEKKKSVMDESARKKKSAEIEQMQQEGEKLIMESNAKLNKLSQELMAPIVDKILEIVRKIGKDEKYEYIIEVGKGGVVYGQEKNDITRSVIDALDKSPPKK
ncbi:MAG: OmpH family outer membrane protein [Pseudomonadota bacterium]